VSGRAIGIFDYLAQKQLLALSLSKAARSKWGVDQGLHNYILHTGLTRAAVSKPNFVRVATLGVAQGSAFTCDSEGRVINPNGGSVKSRTNGTAIGISPKQFALLINRTASTADGDFR
jgi:hypothetical protein